jgi:hypothetical protein
MDAICAALKPPSDFMPELLATLLAEYPKRYRREPLKHWINAAIGNAVPRDPAQQEPVGIRQRLRLYAFAMLTVHVEQRTRVGTPMGADPWWNTDLDLMAKWIGWLDADAGKSFAVFEARLRGMVDAMSTFDDPRIALCVAYGVGDGHPIEPFLMCYARTWYDSQFAAEHGPWDTIF